MSSFRTKTSEPKVSDTAEVSDFLILGNPGAADTPANMTMTLPSPVGRRGCMFAIGKKKTTVTNGYTVTFTASGGATINGASSIVFTTGGDTAVVQSDGAGYQVIARAQDVASALEAVFTGIAAGAVPYGSGSGLTSDATIIKILDGNLVLGGKVKPASIRNLSAWIAASSVAPVESAIVSAGAETLATVAVPAAAAGGLAANGDYLILRLHAKVVENSDFPNAIEVRTSGGTVIAGYYPTAGAENHNIAIELRMKRISATGWAYESHGNTSIANNDPQFYTADPQTGSGVNFTDGFNLLIKGVQGADSDFTPGDVTLYDYDLTIFRQGAGA